MAMQIMMDKDGRRKSARKRNITIVIVLVGLAVGWFGYRPVIDRYTTWKQQKAISQAKAFLDQEEFDSAKLAIDVALDAKPGNVETLRVAADLLEQVGSPSAIRLRRNLVAMQPDSAADRAKLIVTALRYNDLNTARVAMQEMPPAQANEPELLKAALAFAQKTNNKPIADAIYSKLREAEPDNQNLQVLQAALRLRNPRPEIVRAAREELDELAQNPRNRAFILRELMVYAMQRQDFSEATKLAAELSQAPNATLTDHLHSANLALNVDKQPFEEVFATIQPHVSDTPADTVELVRWLILIGQPDQAQTWFAAQSETLLSDSQVFGVRAELASKREDWDTLSGLLEDGAWGAVRQDSVRLAFSAHLAGSRGNTNLQNEIWKETLLSADSNLVDLRVLYRLSVGWDWEQPTEEVLWAITKFHPNQTWAHQTLFNVYQSRKDTEQMLELVDTLRELDISTTRYRYDWALLTLLLNDRDSWTPEKQTMESLHESNPENAYYSTGYAFALALSNRSDEAVEAIEKLSSAERALPERAPYLAFIYARALQPREVALYTDKRDQLQDALPEEIALFDKADDLIR